MLDNILQTRNRTAAELIKSSRYANELGIAEAIVGWLQNAGGEPNARVVSEWREVERDASPFEPIVERVELVWIVDERGKEWSVYEWVESFLPTNIELVANILDCAPTRFETPAEALDRLESDFVFLDYTSWYGSDMEEQRQAYKRLCEVRSQIEWLKDYLNGDPYGYDEPIPAGDW